MAEQKITTIALDLEGTLISNAVSQIPRPGLYSFLEYCRQKFERIAIFTAVNQPRFREIARILVEREKVPNWFTEVEYIEWTGNYKDLSFISDVTPNQMLLIDDRQEYVNPKQINQWIYIPGYDFPYSQRDCELEKIVKKLSLLN